MPHSARKKRPAGPAQKRLQVTDDDGWTHVTTGGNVRRAMRGTRAHSNPTEKLMSPTEDNTDVEPVLGPAEAPGRLTLAELQMQYNGYREKWRGSETWAGLRKQLGERKRARESAAQDEAGPVRGAVDGIVCIGLGSPSGFLRDGWVDRRAVSMFQLAALESIKEELSCSYSALFRLRWAHCIRLVSSNRLMRAAPEDTDIPLSFPVYAQDPVFNDLDCGLLAALGVTVVENPVAFERVTRNTLLFCPGTERKHLELVLPSNPCLVFGGPLESAESEEIRAFVDRTGSRTLVPFSLQEHAFWKMRLYFREEEEHE